jgi:hypothetical protein
VFLNKALKRDAVQTAAGDTHSLGEFVSRLEHRIRNGDCGFHTGSMTAVLLHDKLSTET